MANWHLNAKNPTTFSSQKHKKGELKKSRWERVHSEENQVLAKSRSYKECSLKNSGVKAVYQ